MMSKYHGTFFALLNPFALLCGVLALMLFVTQGATWLQMKTTEALHVRARNVAQITGLISIVLFVIGGFWVQSIEGYVITSTIDTLADSNPLNKEVSLQVGAWMTNFETYPAMWSAPILGVVMPLFAVIASRLERGGFAFLFSSLSNAGVILTAGFAMFPFVMPSSLNPDHSLTMWDSTASELTLGLMTAVAAVMVPVILGYTTWTYYKMFGRLDKKHIEDNDVSAY